MNGRVYDPVVGRFLSVDPLVGNPLSAQDYNGYSYCANNPLAFTDPSGYTTQSMFSFIDRALNSDFGGHWAEGGGGTLFTSDAEAYQAGFDYNNANNSWANTRYPGGATVVNSTSTKFSVSFNFGRFRITKGSWLSLWGRLKDAFFFESKTTGTSWLEPNSPDDVDYLSSQLQPKIDLAIERERTRLKEERNRPANDVYDSEDHYTPYINGVDLTVSGIKPRTLYSLFPFTYTFEKQKIPGVYAPGNNNVVSYVNYSNPPVLTTNVMGGLRAYLVSFDTKGKYSRATLIFLDLTVYKLFIKTEFGIEIK